MFNLPQVGTKALFSFKDPFNTYVKNMLNIVSDNIELTVDSIVSLTDQALGNKRDPYAETYSKVGLTDIEYKQDLKDGVYLITFLYIDDEWGSERRFKIPSNYVQINSTPSSVEYSERAIVIGLPIIPTELDITFIFKELSDVVETLLGVKPEIKDVTSTDIDLIDIDEHETRETVRKNTASVFKTISIRLEEVTNDRDEILRRLKKMNISLGE